MRFINSLVPELFSHALSCRASVPLPNLATTDQGAVSGRGWQRWDGKQRHLLTDCILYLWFFYPYLRSATPSFAFLCFSEPSPKQSSCVSVNMTLAQ